MSAVQQAAGLVLASASPRRRDILAQLGMTFRVMPSGFDERLLPGEDPEAHVQRLAAGKGAEICTRLRDDAVRPYVLAADTIVLIERSVLGKPRDDADAAEMLHRLSGRRHRVLTGIWLGRGAGQRASQRLVATEVEFRALSAHTIRAYVASGEGRDKAGSYAIQGLGAGLVARIEGSYTNVVGMPAVETLELLTSAGVLEGWP